VAVVGWRGGLAAASQTAEFNDDAWGTLFRAQ
jgi:hypothetical protein